MRESRSQRAKGIPKLFDPWYELGNQRNAPLEPSHQEAAPWK
jgi:hypothetical protein